MIDFDQGADHATLRRVLGDCSWAVMVGIEAPGLLNEALTLCPRLLVIQPNSLFAERLRDEWPAGLPPGLQISTALLGSQMEDVTWYSYNDGRLDGTLSPEELCSRHPNLSLLREELRRQRTLDEVVQGWMGQDAFTPAENGCLLLQGHDCCSALVGSTSLLNHLETVVCWVEGRGVIDPAPLPVELVARLEDACFRRSAADTFTWQRDEQRLVERELEWVQIELARLSAAGEAQSQLLQAKDLELEKMAAKIQVAEFERDHLNAAVQEMDRQQIMAQQNVALQEQRCIALENQLADQQRLVADFEVDLQQAGERASALKGQLVQFQQSHDIQQSALEQSAQQREDLHTQLQSLEENCAALQGCLENLQVEHQTLQVETAQIRQERDSFRAGHDLAVEQRDQLDAQLRILRAENEDLRLREQQLARLTEDSEQQLAMVRDLFVQLSATRLLPG